MQRVLLRNEFAFPELRKSLFACFQCACRVDFLHILLCGIIDARGLWKVFSDIVDGREFSAYQFDEATTFLGDPLVLERTSLANFRDLSPHSAFQRFR